jgi:Putative transposase
VLVMSCCNSSPYHDGTTHVVMSPLELMQRLAALVPRPRLHLIRFHGVLAPNAKLRSAIIPSAPVNAPNAAAVHADAPHPSAPVRLSFAQLLKRVFDIDIAQCPQCSGTLTIIAAIEHPPVITKILTHLGLPARAPPRSAARSFDRLQMARSQAATPSHPVQLPEPTSLPWPGLPREAKPLPDPGTSDRGSARNIPDPGPADPKHPGSWTGGSCH